MIEDSGSAVCHDWIVIFTHGELAWRHWWHWWCRPGFGHVFAIRFDPLYGKWYLVDWNLYNLQVQLLSDDEANLVFSLLYDKATFLEMRARRPKARFPRSICMYCVSAVKHLLGDTSLAVTPYQLYCALLKRGARRIVPKQYDTTGV